ncbi:unnamed protein product [Diamesa tonsa]
MSKRDANMRKLSFLGFSRGENADENEAQLDEEMEKVFSAPNANKFDVRKLSDVNIPSNSSKSDKDYQQSQQAHNTNKYNEQDYDIHRKKSYPHPHLPLKAVRTTSTMSHPNSKDSNSTLTRQESNVTDVSTPNSPLSDSDGGGYGNDTVSRPSNFSSYADYTSRDVSENIDEEDQELPQLSEKVVTYNDDDESSSRHVQFNKGNGTKADATEEDREDRMRRKERQYHYKSRKHSLQEYNADNKHREGTPVRRVSVQPEDETLEEADQDDLMSHRSENPKPIRRYKVQNPGPGKGKGKEGEQYLQNIISSNKKSQFDHSPHEVFVQLDELQGQGEDREWKETARWIKYEEDVEEGADRWGRPHVASLSFHSLLNLRRCLETGVVLMDLEEKDLPGVAYRVVEQMVVEELIHPDDKAAVMRALLLRHRHVNDHSHGAFHFGGRRKYSSYSSLQNVNDTKQKGVYNGQELNGFNRNGSNGDTKIDMNETTYTSSQEDLKRLQHDSILKRIPENSEATTVLVGSVDFLEQPTIAFVRLAEGIMMPSITEVPIPVRFLFILLGPKTADLDYHEVGRSIATLMSNRHFHGIAYKADDRKELLSAINEFLDDSIVLPPGKWDREQLLPFDELKAKSDMIRSRKKKALDEKMKAKQPLISSEDEKKLLAAADDDDRKKPKGPLEKTHRLWGGVINDLKRRLPMYKSDITDGLNTETLAATIFMYFAALSTAITFGGLASDKTNNLIGISETLISASFVGVIFHALSGQPLTIVGTTGPLLLFDEALIQFCLANGFEFLTVRVYVGIWLTIIALLVSAFEGSVYVRLFTRFTQEIFSALITLIYIVETALNMISVYVRHPLLPEYNYTNVSDVATPANMSSINDSMNELDGNVTDSTVLETTMSSITSALSSNATAPLLIPSDALGPRNQPNTALFCMCLTLGTFALAYFLRIFRNSKFFGRNARRALGDFGVPISIAIFVTLSYFTPQVFTDKLSVPQGISPSDPSRRGWQIPLGPVPIWLPFISLVPALLVYILIFMETHISELIVDKPERGLKKGSGLHMDIVLLCFLNTVCGFFGLPWHCAATVRSVTHVSAVTIMSTNHAPGDAPRIADVKEQRLSGFFVSMLVGLSVAAAPLLRKIPMSVLFGVFLYMGVASMSGVQLFERLRLLFMPVKYHSQAPFVRRVPTWKMHIFTLVQFLALGMLWAVKSSRFSLAFPFFLVLMVPIRKQLERLYTPLELRALDGSQPNEGAESEPDFYEQASIPA